MLNSYSLLQLIVDIFLSVILFICLCINVFLRRHWQRIDNKNIIITYRLVRVSFLFSFVLCFMTGFLFMEKNWFSLSGIIIVTGWFFVSNILFIQKQKQLYKETVQKERLKESHVLDQDI